MGTIDATPSKRLFFSIIADYDLNKAICELIDNALDEWVIKKKNQHLQIDLTFNLAGGDNEQQTITIKDNAGGIRNSDLTYVVAPGYSGNIGSDETIGIFGVGTKRAVVHLAKEIRIKTGAKKGKAYQVKFNDDWIQNDPNWELTYDEIDEDLQESTIIELQKLRTPIDRDDLLLLKNHIRTTYARFLEGKEVTITLNGKTLKPITFDNWAYPPGYAPRKYEGEVKTTNSETFKIVKVEVVSGLISSPADGEYGVYFYCNDRLIARGLKTYDVGFAKGLAGKPHPSISITRTIISLYGEPTLMPWNGSKSDINTNHRVFIAIRNWLVQVVKDYASLSRRLKEKEGGWNERVFKHKAGKMVNVKIKDFPTAKTSSLPPLPISRPRYGNIVEEINKAIVAKKPWTKGLYESIIAVNLIFKKNLEEKNRICLIILDGNLEIAFKEFLVHESGKSYDDQKLQDIFESRGKVLDEMKKYKNMNSKLWEKIEYYYKMRCDLFHRRVSHRITDEQIKDFRNVVEEVLRRLFNLSFKDEQ